MQKALAWSFASCCIRSCWLLARWPAEIASLCCRLLGLEELSAEGAWCAPCPDPRRYQGLPSGSRRCPHCVATRLPVSAVALAAALWALAARGVVLVAPLALLLVPLATSDLGFAPFLRALLCSRCHFGACPPGALSLGGVLWLALLALALDVPVGPPAWLVVGAPL